MRHRRPCGYEVVALLAAAVLLLFPTALFSQDVASGPVITRLAGTGSSVFNGDSGLANSISLNTPTFVVTDNAGSQYISDTGNNCVRRIDPTGNITTVAGLVSANGPDTCDASSNPNPTPAQGLEHPTGLAIDTTGRLYIADSLHHCIRTLAPGATGTAALTTVAGSCGADASISITPNPMEIVSDPSGNLYIAVQNPMSTAPIFQVLRHAAVSGPTEACIVAGVRASGLSLCPNLSGTARLDHPTGLALDATNNLYIADAGNQCVRKLTNLTTLGTAVGQCANDGSGTSLTALRNPFGLAVTSTNTLLITQSNPDTVVSLTPGTSSLTRIAGLANGTAAPYDASQEGAVATTVPLNAPRGIAIDLYGNIVLVDSGNNILRRIAVAPPIPVTIRVNDATRTYGSPNPSFTASITGALPFEKIGESLIITCSTAATTRSASGRYSITATLSGPSAANYEVTIQPGTLQITPAATATTLTSTASSSATSTTVTLTANVNSAAGTPAGIVAFYDNGTTLLGTSSLDANGTAALTTSTLTPGTHPLVAIFRDTNNYSTSAATLTQAIAAPTGSFTLSASQPMPSSKSAGQSVYQLTVNSVGIFSGTVALSCSGLPAGGSCAFSSNPTLAPGSTANVMLTITTPATRAALAPLSTPTLKLGPLTAITLFPIELPVLSTVLVVLRKKRSRMLFLLTAIALAIAPLTGCGTGATPGTTAASATTTSYTVQVTGTSLTFAAPPQTITLAIPAQ